MDAHLLTSLPLSLNHLENKLWAFTSTKTACGYLQNMGTDLNTLLSYLTFAADQMEALCEEQDPPAGGGG